MSSDWFNANNWSPVGVPASNDIVNFTSGVIDLTAPVTIGNQFNWSGGGLTGNALTIASNAVLSITGTSPTTLEIVLTNAGTVTLAGTGNFCIYNNGGSSQGAIYNVAGALFDIQNAQSINCGCLGSEFFTNAGTLRTSSPTSKNPNSSMTIAPSIAPACCSIRTRRCAAPIWRTSTRTPA